MTGVLAFALLLGALELDYKPAGALLTGTGYGVTDKTNWSQGMRFPVEVSPAFLNSQVWAPGGSQGPADSSQCDAANYSMPWRDNFCETRTYDNPLCPAGAGHQGQDIRPPTCANATHWAVAVESGTITYIGTYSVNLVGESGVLYRYLHMAPDTLTVSVGDEVARGEALGKISNAFGTSRTTIHLHLELWRDVENLGLVPVPPYTALVDAYEAGLTSACDKLPPEGGVLDDAGPCVVFFGPRATWRSVSGDGYGGGLRWTHAWSSSEPGNWARWRIRTSEAGTYMVRMYVVGAYAQSQAVPIAVRHRDGETALTVDLSAQVGWVSLGAFELGPDADGSVAIYDNTGESSTLSRRIAVDALEVVRVPAAGEDEPLDRDDGGAGDDGDSDAVTGDVDESGDHDTTPADTDTTVGDSDTAAPDDDRVVVIGEVDEVPRWETTNAARGCAEAGPSGVYAGIVLLLRGCVARRRTRA